MRIRQIAISLVSVFAMAVSTTVGFASTSASAAPVTSGVCTATVGSSTGVTMTVVSGECVLKFTNVGTTTWTVPSGVTSARTLVVGAGGGGSADVGGGGGGGQVVDKSTTAVSGEVTISVGAGGTAGYGATGSLTGGGSTGSSSSFVSSETVTAKGGSGATGRSGANNKNADGTANNTGYTGGGAAYGVGESTGTGGVAYKGGSGGSKSVGQGGGGGGGAGGVGQSKSIAVAPDGGVGLSSNITGAVVFYGGGGGGSTTYSSDGPAGAGGNGGGGAGSKIYVNGVAGVNGFGGGGGGGGSQASSGGGTGGSGVVIVRYSLPVIPSNTGAPVISGTASTGSTLTTSNGSWTGPPTSYGYQWKRASTVGGTYSDIATATSSSYVVSESDIGYFIKVSITGTNGLGSASATSAATTAVVDIAPTNTALPVISGSARNGATLTATNGSWTSSPSLFAYQWKRASTVGGSYIDITSATSSTYVANESDVGYFVKVSVTATNNIGPSSAALSAATSAVVDIAPTNTALPVISGTARTGATLTATNGSWTSSPPSSTTYTYQWKRASTVGGTYSNITSETGSSYVVDESDVGYFIKVSVVATNGVGSSSAALSTATTAVVDIAPANTARPVISGTARTGATLTATNGSWTSSPSLFEYQWKRASTVGGTYSNITSATDSTYVVDESDVGDFIRVSVTATNNIGPSSAALSTATTAVVDIAPTNRALPVISGTARTGATLTATNGSWTSSPSTFEYQWKRASTVGGTYSNITSETGSSYVVDESDVGYFIKVSVIATNGVGSSSAALSSATTAVVDIAPANTARPVISGTARTGATLTATNGSWTSSPSTFEYQWKRASTVGGSYSNITSETGRTYVVDESDVGYFIKVSVIATNGVGSSSAALSTATTAVVDIAPTNTALPVITGTARTGATLTTSNGSWTSAPNSSTTYTYQWKRASTVGGSYSNITSATDKTYELTDTDIDKFIKVSVIATNSIGPSSAVLSAATAAVLDLTDSVVPTVTSPDATATGFTFTISNHSPSYTYVLTTSKGTVSRSNDDVTVTGLAAGESATVTIAVARANYKPASKTVTGSATPATTTTTTTTLKPAVVVEVQAPVTTVAQGQTSVATVAPSPAPVTTVAQGQASVATIAPSVSRALIPVTTTTTTTTTPATAIVPLVKNAVIPTASPTTSTITPRVKNAAFPTAQPKAPMIAEVSTGESALDVGGVRTNVDVSRENNKIVLKSGSYQAVLSGVDSSGVTRSLDVDGNLRLTSGDVLRLNMGGFNVGTQVEVWMFSTPVRLGTTKVEADGQVTGTFTIPKNIEDGSHRIAVTAKLPNGKSTTFTLGILVGDLSTTSTLTRVLIAIPISLAVFFGLLLPTRVRRRKKLAI